MAGGAGHRRGAPALRAVGDIAGAHREGGIPLRGKLQRQADAYVVGAVSVGEAPGQREHLLAIHSLAQTLVGDLLALRVVDAEGGFRLKAKELVEGRPVERDL